MADGHPQYPVNLTIVGWRCLVVGGGEVAAGKVTELLRCGAEVVVVAPEVCSAIVESDGVVIHNRPYVEGEAAEYRLVIAATDSSAVNRQVFTDAEAGRVPVNAADDPQNCTFTLPARVRRGDLLVTISTGGRSPAFSSWMRRRIEAALGDEYAQLLDLLAAEREELSAAGTKVAPSGWQNALDSGMLEMIRAGRTSEAKERLRACLSSQSD